MGSPERDGTAPRGAGRPAPVAVTGWFCAVAGVVMVLSAAVLALGALSRRALEEQGIDPFASLEGTMDPLSRTLLRNLETLSAMQLLLGSATLAVGIGFLRLRPWARLALEILAWVTLAGSLAAGAWDVLAWLRPDGSGSVFFPGGAAGRAAGMVLTLAQCVVCVLIIRYLRTEEIRSLFLRRTDPSGP
mgnify:FL=1